jgi:hypothetical protein
MLLVERHGLRRNGKGTQLPAPEHRKQRADSTSTPVRTGWVVRLCLRPNLDPPTPASRSNRSKVFLRLSGTRLSATAAASELPPSLPPRAG